MYSYGIEISLPRKIFLMIAFLSQKTASVDDQWSLYPDVQNTTPMVATPSLKHSLCLFSMLFSSHLYKCSNLTWRFSQNSIASQFLHSPDALVTCFAFRCKLLSLEKLTSIVQYHSGGLKSPKTSGCIRK